MKKTLLGTLVISTLSASAIAAEAPTLKLGGRMDFMAGSKHEKSVYNRSYPASYLLDASKSKQTNSNAFVNDTSIDVNIDGVTDCGLKYGGLIRLHADTSVATNDEPGFADKTMIYVQSDKFGRMEGGNYPGAGAMLEMDTTSFIKATYGVDGYWSKWASNAAFINLPGIGNVLLNNMSGFRYITTANLPSNSSGYYYSDAPKLSYYTIPYPGLTVGVSYIPDLDSTGTISTVAYKDAGPTDAGRQGSHRSTFREIFSGGLQYKTSINDFNIKASAVGEIGKAKKYKGTDYLRDLRAYEFGTSVNYKGYTLAGTFGSWGKTATYKEKYSGTKQGSSYWTIAAMQETGNLGYSVSFMKSKKAGGLEAMGPHIMSSIASVAPDKNIAYSDTSYNKFHNLSFGVDYKLAPGLLPYAEISYFRFKSAQEPVSNKGTLFLTGMRLTF